MLNQIGKIAEALASLSVGEGTLTNEEKQSLDEHGYVIMEDVIDAAWLKELQLSFEALADKEGDKAGTEFNKEAGTRRLSDLINKGEVFDRVWLHPRMLAAAYHVIGGDFKMNSINARDALPGEGHQALHADWGPRRADDPYQGINTIWLLDDFTPDNGATRIVPGTHRLAGKPSDYMEDVMAAHPDENLVLAKAGTVFVYNLHMWHGGTQNRTGGPRRVLHPSYVARACKQQLNQREYVRKSTYDRLSPAARYLLDVD